MLLILNGAPKGGSTWLVLIVQAMRSLKRIPDAYQDPQWSNSSIDEPKVVEFLGKVDFAHQHYFCKQHWVNEGDIAVLNLLTIPNLKMVNIIRDVRDVLVSRYFHDLRLNLTQVDNIEDYYVAVGKQNMQQYMEYHISWHSSQQKLQPFLCSYEQFHENFADHLRELIDYLGLSSTIGEREITEIEEKTSFSSRKETGTGKFFRKGIVGDWENHLSQAIVEDLKQMAIETGYLKTKANMCERFNLDILKEIDFGVSETVSLAR
jgi:hypothetical protein